MQIGDVDVRVSDVMWFSVTGRQEIKEQAPISSMTIFMRSGEGISEGIAATEVTDEQVEALRYALDGKEPPVASGDQACRAEMMPHSIAQGVRLEALCTMPRGHKGAHGFEATEFRVIQSSPYLG